jgi:hypothetical protein
MRKIAFVGAAGLALAAAPAAAGNWSVQGAGNGHGERVTIGLEEGRAYSFECAPDGLVVTQIGVTDLLDPKTNTKVGDAPGSAMPPGAAVMGLFTGDGDPELLPASAAPNPAKGWDMALRFAKADRRVKALAKAEFVSLFTTGYTAAIPLDGDDRKLFAGFLKRCRG